MNRALLLGLAGLLAGGLTFLIREPSAPKIFGDPAWLQWQTITGMLFGLLTGALIGFVSGYFQGSRVHLTKGVMLGAIIGAAGGSFGISLASVIYGLISSAGFGIIPTGLAARSVGWAIMGGIIGLCEGAVGMSWKRAYYGFIGGVLGGAIGGALFEVVGSTIGPTQLGLRGQETGETGTIPRAVGFAVTGFGIGLLIGVVEAIAQKAWVRLILGRNEGKDWPVDARETFLGRAENAHIPLRGDSMTEPFHAAIRKERGQYVIHDLQTPIGIAVNGVPTRQAILNNGDTFQIGHHTLQFLIRGAPKPSYTPQVQQMQFQTPVAPQNAQVAGIAPMQAATPTSQPTIMAAPAPTGLAIVATTGPLAGQRFFVNAPLEIGRETPPVPLSFDTQASRRHARLEPTPGGVQVTDLGSTNGTLVNGQRVQSTLARIGDLLTIGSTTFRIEPT